MKILQASEGFGGGVFTSVTCLCNGLAERGHEVHLAFARRDQTPADVSAHIHPGVRLHELRMVRPLDVAADLVGMWALWRLLRALAPDVVHYHSSKAGAIGRVASWLAGYGARTYYSPRGLAFLQEDHPPRTRLLYEKIEWLIARLGGTIVACSPSEREIVRERIAPRRAALVENAVDVLAIPARVDRADQRLRVGMIGRITYQKNPDLFAAMARRFSSPSIDFRWIGGGDAIDQAKLEDAGVSVTGWLSRAEALAEICQLDIYLHPSRWEGMPIALIEAQVCGLPAVATDIVGNRDVIRQGETGFVSRDPEEMRHHLARLLDDAQLRHQMGVRAREQAISRFNLTRLVDEMERLYAGALNSPDDRSR